MAITITYDAQAGAYALKFPYEPALVAQIKSIPASGRRWDPVNKNWQISPDYLKKAQLIVGAFFPDAVWPVAQQKTAQPEVRLLDVRYLGQCKERAPGEINALGLLENKHWGAIFPQDVLTCWFDGGITQRLPGLNASLYSVLGVPQSANDAEVKSGYRRMVKQWHPDICREPNAQDVFMRVKEAYDILSDPEKRARYNAGLFLEASMSRPTDSTFTASNYRAPLRCGLILAEGVEALGRFAVSKILAWEDITDHLGRTLVTSWPLGSKEPVEAWA